MTVKLFKIFQIKKIKNTRGDIVKIVDKKKKYFKGFGELYLTEIKKGEVKGWNYHKRNICLLYVASGKVKFYFKEKIKNTFTKSITINYKMNKILQINNNTWFAFTSYTKKSLVFNFMNKIHNPKETLKDQITSFKKLK